MSVASKKEICPDVNTKVLFSAATAFARKIDKKDKIIVLTSRDRGQMAKLDSGWIVIDQEWFAK
jgi:hypothetical protein